MACAVVLAATGVATVSPATAEEAHNGRIAYVSHGDIYTIRQDGTGARRLTRTGDNSSPAWSPDGGRIAFASTRDGNSNVLVMDADGTGVQRISGNPAFEGEPQWSPDGTQIVYVGTRTGTANLYRIRSTRPTGDPVQLTFLQESTNDGTGCRARNPTWSPDGRYIVYDEWNYCTTHEPWYSLQRISAVDGSGSQWIARGGDADYHPFANRLVFTRQDPGCCSRLVKWNVGSTAESLLTEADEGVFAANARWSPNGRRIVYDQFDWKAAAPVHEVRTMKADGTDVQLLVADASEPDWQPVS